MKKTLKLTGKAVLASLLLTGGFANIANAASGADETYKNMTLEERLYLFDGYGSKWGLDAGSDGLWFVAERPIGDTYDAALKIRNDASSNTLVIGGGDGDTNTTSPEEGYVGIGTNTPVEKVDVESVDGAGRFQLTSITNTANEAAQFIQRRAHSNSGSPTAVEASDNMGFFSFRGWNGTEWTGTKAGIAVKATENWSETANGTQIAFLVTKNGTTSLKAGLKVLNNADVLIPNGNLYVKGTKMNVPDYVFAEDYKLMPLNELKTFIEKNNHLPGVASADEVDKSGLVNLSGLQMTLLEKVEELTLYTLQQDEALKIKDAKIAEMEEKIAKLEAMQNRLAKVESLLTNLALETSKENQKKLSFNK